MIRFPRPSDCQKKYLLEFLTENPEYVAHNGFSDYQIKMDKWQTVANKLNELEGTEKPGEQWYKYWCDLKRKTKVKAFTPSRPKSSLTIADKTVLELAGIPLPDFADLRSKFMPKKANLQCADMDYEQFGVEYKNVILTYMRQSLDIVNKPEQNVELVDAMIKELNEVHKRNKRDYKKEWYWYYWMQKWIRIVRTNVNLNKLKQLKEVDVELYKVMKFDSSNLNLTEDQLLHLLTNIKKHMKAKKMWENVSLEMEDLCGCKKGSLYWKIYVDVWSKKILEYQQKSPEYLTSADLQLLHTLPELANKSIKSEQYSSNEENDDEHDELDIKPLKRAKVEEPPTFAFYDVNDAEESDQVPFSLDMLHDKCRVCLKEAKKLTNIFKNKDNLDLPYKMNICASISPVTATDKFPRKICKSCLGLVEAAFTYKKLAENSDAILRKQKHFNCDTNDRKVTRSSTCVLRSYAEDELEKAENCDENDEKTHSDDDTKDDITFSLENMEDNYESDSLDEDLNLFWKEEVKPLLETTVVEKKDDSKKRNKYNVEYLYNDDGEMYCSHCKYKTKNRRNYRSHVVGHSEAQACICEICGKVCKNNSAVHKHKKTHQEIRQIKCDICDYRTYAMSKLRVHLRKHTGEQPYQCPHCTKRASTTSNLRIHIKTHKELELINPPVAENPDFLSSI